VYVKLKMAIRFLGLEMPFEAKQALRTLPTVDGSFEPVLEAVIQVILGQPATHETRSLQRLTSLDSSTFCALLTGLDWLLRACMRSSVKTKLLHAELTDARVHPACIQPILLAVERGRVGLACDLSGGDTLPTLEALRWRLDVCISTSSLHRVLRPQLTMSCTLGDGSLHAFHVSKQRFNELRFTAAKCLKEMQDMENRLPLTQ